MKKSFIVPVLLLLLSCKPDSQHQSVTELLAAMEQQELEQIRTMAPVYSHLSNEELEQLCISLEDYYEASEILIRPLGLHGFSVEIKNPRQSEFQLKFSMKKGVQGSYKLSQGFSLSQRIQYIANEE